MRTIASLQSGVPLLLLSVTATPQPQAPGVVEFGSFGHWSEQSGVPSPSVSTAVTSRVAVHVAVLPAASAAVMVIVVKPLETVEPASGD